MSELLSAEDYLRFPQQAGDFRYDYGAHPLQFAELSLPASAPPHPVVSLIHGGCYRELYDLRPLSSLVTDLVGLGYAVWNIEYRRHGCEGGFPRMFLDAAAAVDFLRQIAVEHELDLERVISAGHSAGGTPGAVVGWTQAHSSRKSLVQRRPHPDTGRAGLGAADRYRERLAEGRLWRGAAGCHGRLSR